MFENLTQEERLELYNRSKELYYTGEEESPLSDFEFDQLEKELGLENVSRVGSFHKKNYTISHPILMGSISKVNVLEEPDGSIDWKKYDTEITKYLSKSKGYDRQDWYFTAGVKLDGCSWEAVIDPKGNLVSVSSRGDGTYGKSLIDWFQPEWEKRYKNLVLQYFNELDDHSHMFLRYLIVRGECLIKKSTFDKKYKDLFAIPRNFVSGVLNQDFKGTPEQLEYRADLDWVSYRYIEQYDNDTNLEIDYLHTPSLPGNKLMDVFEYHNVNSKVLYDKFEKIRNEYDYESDGIVIQPGTIYKLNDYTRARQQDSCALKFLPEVVPATVKDIEWNVSKNGEYVPTGILEEVILGGKKVNRVSFHNYGYVRDNGLWLNSKITIKLGGDIVPQVDTIVEPSTSVISLPEDSYIDGIHLMKTLSENDKMYIRFTNSANVLQIDGIGEKVAAKLFEILPTRNIINFMITEEWKRYLDDSKSSQNIIKSLEERKKTLTLPDVIQSMGYENCGEKNALWLAKVVSGLNPDSKGIPTSIIELSEDNSFLYDVERYMELLGLKPLVEESSDKIPVILTGSPKECGYSTKADFLTKHPQFVETTKWGECKILFTDDLESTSSKMEKAKKLGIEIKCYI